MDKYKVTFIVPVYNVEKYIEECLESLINQTIDSKEIIIVNDGSKDSSMDIVSQYASKYKFIKVVNQSNKGLSEARNTGLKMALGKYIQFVDSDDYVDIEFAEEFYNLCEKYNLDIIRGQYRIFNEKDNELKKIKKLKNKVNCKMSSRDYFNESIRNKSYEVTAILGFYKKEFLIRNHLYFRPNVTMEDHEFTLRFLTQDESCRLMEVNNPFYIYRIRAQSITTTYKRKNIEDILMNIENMKKYVDSNDFNSELRINCFKAISTLLYHATSVYGRLNKSERKMARPLFDKKIIKFSAKYSYTKHQKIKFLICYLFWPIMEFVYNIKALRLN